ncbi:hypothetical protein Ancab_002892 [Ancistrocladus abbreviatus]
MNTSIREKKSETKKKKRIKNASEVVLPEARRRRSRIRSTIEKVVLIGETVAVSIVPVTKKPTARESFSPAIILRAAQGREKPRPNHSPQSPSRSELEPDDSPHFNQGCLDSLS